MKDLVAKVKTKVQPKRGSQTPSNHKVPMKRTEQPPVAPWRMDVPVPPPPTKSAPAAPDSKPSAAPTDGADGSAPSGPAVAPPAAFPLELH